MKADFRQFIRFVAVSLLAAVLNICSRVVFSLWFPYTMAIMLAFLLGMSTAFLLNRSFVFIDHMNPIQHQAFWFAVVNLAALVQTLAISLILARWIFPAVEMHWHEETVAHAIGVAAPAITSFLGHKHLSFRQSRQQGVL